MRAREILRLARAGVCMAPLVSAALLASIMNAPAARADAVAPGLAAPSSDQNGPIVTIMKPGYNDQLQGAANILIAVQQRRYTPQSVEFFVDDLSATSSGPIPLTSLPSAAFHWPTDKYADGPHKLTVRVTDTQGFIGQSEVTVYINNNKVRDVAPPVLAWLSPKAGDVLHGNVFVQLQAVDNFGVKYVIVALNPADSPDQKPPVKSWFVNQPPYIVKLDTGTVPDGMYVLKSQAWDALENFGESQPIPIGISNHSINPTWMPDLKARANATKTGPAPTAVAPSAGSNGGGGQVETPHVQRTQGGTKSTAPAAPVSPGTPATGDGPDRIAKGPDFRNPQRQGLLSMVHSGKTPNGTIQGAMQPSLWAQVGPTSGNGAKIAQCASLPPLNPAKLPAVIRSNSHALPSPNYPLIPSPILTPGGTGAASDGAISAPAFLTSGHAPTTATSRHTPGHAALAQAPSRATSGSGVSHAASDGAISAPAFLTSGHAPTTATSRHTPGHAALAQAPSRATSGSGVSHAAALTPTDAGSDNTRISPTLNAHPAPRPQVPVRTTAPSGAPRTVIAHSGTVPAGSAGLTKMALPNETHIASAAGATSHSPATHPARPSLPRVAMNPDFSTHPQARNSADITVAPVADWTVATALPASYVARRDETLAAIAARYKLPAEVLATANNLPANARLAAGTKVAMPRPLLVTYHGKPVTGDVASMLVGSTGVTPFRFLFQAQGGQLEWDAKNHRVLARNATHQVTLVIGSNSATVNNKEVMMDLAAFLLSGRTMVPIRFFEKALQAHVEWEPGTGRLYVAMAADGK